MKGNKMEKKPEVDTKITKAPRSKLLLLTFIIATIALLGFAASAYQMYIVKNTTQANTHKVLSGLQNKIDDFEKTQKQQKIQINNIDNSIQQLLKHQTSQQSAWLLEEAKHLMRLAFLYAKFNPDVPVMIKLLEASDEKLKAMGDPKLIDIRQSLKNHIAQLQNISVVDLEDLLLKFNALNEQIHALKLIDVPNSKKKVKSTKALTQQPPQHTWQRAQEEIKNIFSKMVIIRHYDAPIQSLIEPAQRILIEQNVLVLLQQAKWAALNRNPGIYKLSLQQATRTIKRYFSEESHSDVLKSIEELATQNISPTLPDLSDTINLLEATHS